MIKEDRRPTIVGCGDLAKLPQSGKIRAISRIN